MSWHQRCIRVSKAYPADGEGDQASGATRHNGCHRRGHDLGEKTRHFAPRISKISKAWLEKELSKDVQIHLRRFHIKRLAPKWRVITSARAKQAAVHVSSNATASEISAVTERSVYTASGKKDEKGGS